MVNHQEPFEHDSDGVHLQPLLDELRQKETHTTLLDDMSDEELVPSWLAELQAAHEPEPEDVPTERTMPGPRDPTVDFESLVLGEGVVLESGYLGLDDDGQTDFFSPLPPEDERADTDQLSQEALGATVQEQEAERLAEDGRYEEAIVIYDQLLQTFPWLANVQQWQEARHRVRERLINGHFHHVRLAYQSKEWTQVLDRLNVIEVAYPLYYEDNDPDRQKLVRRIAGLRQKVEDATKPPPMEELPVYLNNGLSTDPLVQHEPIAPLHPVSQTHQQFVGFLYRLLQGFVEAQQLGTILFAPVTIEVNGQSLKPDLAFLPMGLERPSLIIEVSQPETLIQDRLEKFRQYEQAGVQEYWLIDSRPFQQQIDVYSLNKKGCYEPSPPDQQGIFHSEAMSGFWFNTAWLWSNNSLPPVHAILTQLLADAPNIPQPQRELYRQLTQFFT